MIQRKIKNIPFENTVNKMVPIPTTNKNECGVITSSISIVTTPLVELKEHSIQQSDSLANSRTTSLRRSSIHSNQVTIINPSSSQTKQGTNQFNFFQRSSNSTYYQQIPTHSKVNNLMIPISSPNRRQC